MKTLEVHPLVVVREHWGGFSSAFPEFNPSLEAFASAGTARVGFGNTAPGTADAVAAVREHFRPEFFNRLDHVVPFALLTSDALRKIVDLELHAMQKREGLSRRKLELVVDDAAKARLAELGWHEKYGARPLKRVLEERVLSPVAIQISRQPMLSNQRVRVTCSEGEIVVAFG